MTGVRDLATLKEEPIEKYANIYNWKVPSIFPQITNIDQALNAGRMLNPIKCKGKKQFVTMETISNF